MAVKIGVFLCECGPNIKDALHFDALRERVEKMPDVAVVQAHRLYCSADAQEEMVQAIREHEHTFRRVLEPQMDAVLHHDHIELITHAEVESVVGYFGNFSVTVRRKARYVDPVACIGCGACVDPCPATAPNPLTSGLDEKHAMHFPFKGALPNVPLIDMKLCVRGHGEACTVCQDNCAFGAVNFEDQDELRPIDVGAVVLATGFDLFDPARAPQYGHGVLPDVYTQLEMEYLVSKNGPTGGKAQTRDGRTPRRIALLHCVGSRSAKFRNHCSSVCCVESLKLAHILHHQLPEAEITVLHQDLCLPDKGAQGFLDQVRAGGVRFVHVDRPDALRVEAGTGGMAVRSPELNGDASALDGLDMVVLGTVLEGARDNPALAALFDLSVDASGFFCEAHGKLDPVGTTTAGVLTAGAAQWPKSIEGAVAQGQAAAGRVLQRLMPGEMLELDPCVSCVDTDACSGCKMCMSLCPYRALQFDDVTKRMSVSEVLCKGCGVCAASCPSSAITARHFTDAQIVAEVRQYLA